MITRFFYFLITVFLTRYSGDQFDAFEKIRHEEMNATNSKLLQQEISLCLTSRDEFSEADPPISLPESFCNSILSS